MIKDSSNIIQAVPITASTYVGAPTNLSADGFSIVHCNEDTTLTFTFVSDVVSVTARAGQDFAIGEGCKTITSTAEVILS